MTTNYDQLLFDLCNIEAKELQRVQGMPEKGIVSTQVLAVVKVLSRLLAVLQMQDALEEMPK
jgi:hypothetical protein